MVLKEEFFPLMGEMKEQICTLTAAGQGMCLLFTYLILLGQGQKRCDLRQKVILISPCVPSFRAVGL